MKKKLTEVTEVPDEKTQEPLEGLKNPEVCNLNNDEARSNPDLGSGPDNAGEGNHLVEGVASGTSPTGSIDRIKNGSRASQEDIRVRLSRAICQALSHYVRNAMGISDSDGYCWVRVSGKTFSTLANKLAAAPYKAAVAVLLVLFDRDGEFRFELHHELLLKFRLIGPDLVIILVQDQEPIRVTRRKISAAENALETLRNRLVQVGYGDSDVFVLISIADEGYIPNGWITSGEAKVYRAPHMSATPASA